MFEPRPPWFHRVILALAALSSALGASALAQSPAAGSISADSSRLPTQVEPLTAEQQEALAPLIEAAQKYRGLKLKEPLVAGAQSQESLHGTLAEQIGSSKDLAAGEAVLRHLGLWPDDRTLEQSLLDLLSGEVAGYYDPEVGFLSMIEGNEGGAIDALAAFGPLAVDRLQESVWVHEIGHALQDQHFDLETLLADDDTLFSDSALARRSLVEGDAMVMTSSHIMTVPMERFPTARGVFSQMIDHPKDWPR